MRVTVTTGSDLDDLETLAAYLRRDEQFSGRVRKSAVPVEPGHLGTGIEGLVVELGGSLLTALTTVLVIWIRRRGGRVKVNIRTESGTRVNIEADDVQNLNADAIDALVVRIVRELDPPPAGTLEAGNGNPAERS